MNTTIVFDRVKVANTCKKCNCEHLGAVPGASEFRPDSEMLFVCDLHDSVKYHVIAMIDKHGNLTKYKNSCLPQSGHLWNETLAFELPNKCPFELEMVLDAH